MKRMAIGFALALASTFGVGCEAIQKKPIAQAQRAVDQLAANLTDGGDLVATWSNPIDFQRVEVEMTYVGADGKPVKLAPDRFPVATMRGGARAILLDAPPGAYVIRVGSKPDTFTPPKWAETKFVVPTPLSDGLITEADLRRRIDGRTPVDVPVKQRLHVLYAIHPDALAALDKVAPHVEQLFRQMTFSALTNVFASALEVSAGDIEGDTSGLGIVQRIEDYAALVTAGRQALLWPLRPDALVFVDIRLASADAPGQLEVRLHDLRLTNAVDDGTGLRDRLYNVRPLVYERFAEVGLIEDVRDEAEITSIFRDAWLENMSHVLRHPRYAEYTKLTDAYRRAESDLPESLQQRVQNLFLAELASDLRPYDPAADNPVQLYEQRTDQLMDQLLFGPGVAGPMDIHPNDRFEKPPEAPAAPKPAEPEPAESTPSEPASTEPGKTS